MCAHFWVIWPKVNYRSLWKEINCALTSYSLNGFQFNITQRFFKRISTFVLGSSFTFAITSFSVHEFLWNITTLFNLYVAFARKYMVYNFLCVVSVAFVGKVDRNLQHSDRNCHVEEARGYFVSSQKVMNYKNTQVSRKIPVCCHKLYDQRSSAPLYFT